MDPMTQFMLTSLFGSLGGLLFKDNSNEKLMEMLRNATSPAAFSKMVKELYDKAVASPAFAGAQASIGAGANAIAGRTAANLAERGLTTSGIGAITGAVGSSTAGFQMADLQSKFYSQAEENAMGLIRTMMGGAGALRSPRNIGADIYSGTLDSLGKYFLAKTAPKPTAATSTPMPTTYTGGSLGLDNYMKSLGYFDMLNPAGTRR